ncbi:MAG: hypothetical protein ACRC5T_09795 [Cetobacterium sp.]
MIKKIIFGLMAVCSLSLACDGRVSYVALTEKNYKEYYVVFDNGEIATMERKEYSEELIYTVGVTFRKFVEFEDLVLYLKGRNVKVGKRADIKFEEIKYESI